VVQSAKSQAAVAVAEDRIQPRIMDKLFRPYSAHLQVRMELPSGMIKSFVAAGWGFADQRQLCSRSGVGWTCELIPIQDKECGGAGIAYRRDEHDASDQHFISTVRSGSASK